MAMAMTSSRALVSPRAPTVTRVARERRPRARPAAARAREGDAGDDARASASASSSDARGRVVSARERDADGREGRARARDGGRATTSRGNGRFVANGNDDAGRRDGTGDGATRRRANETYVSTSRTRARGRDEGRGAARREEILLTRGLILNKLVVTRTSGSRLGVATELWVDTDEWEVVALDVRQNAFVGTVDHVLLESLRQVGDVILVHDEDAVEQRWSAYGYSQVVGKDVVTESGQFIGRVRDFEFDPEDGAIARLIVDAWGVPTVPEGVVSTYAVDVAEVIECGQERILVAEDAESRVEQLSVSVLQRLALTAPPWEEEEMYGDEYYADAYYGEYGERAARSRRVVDEYAAYSDRRRGDERAPAMRSAYERPRARREGIPLVRPTQPYERRDVDGGYGDRPGFNDWVVRDTRRTEREFETVDAYWEPPTRRASVAASPPAGRFPRGGEPPRGDNRRPRSPTNPSPPPATRAPRRPNDIPRSSGTFDAAEDML